MFAALVVTAVLGACAPVGDEPMNGGGGQVGGQAGVRQRGVFDTPAGRQLLEYTLIDGQRVFEGDILLPPPVTFEPDRGVRSAGLIAPSARWPNNTVVYRFAANLPQATRARALDAMSHWRQTTSVRFAESATATNAAQFVVPSSPSTCRSSVGYAGNGQMIELGANCGVGAIIHEIGHAVGLWHEQSRADRQAFVNYDPDCASSVGSNNYSPYAVGADYGLYDFASVMHYPSESSPVTASCPSGTPLWRRSSPAGSYDAIPQPAPALSFIDRQGVEEMYSESFGKAVAFGDFNNDGYRDVAISAPRRGSAHAGHVLVYRGSASGFTLDADFDQGLNAQSEDRFGYALATGDFNNDGHADLAVGVPGEDGNAGRVVVYRGRSGLGNVLAHWVNVDQTGLGANQAGDRFGWALTAGDFDRDGYTDLGVGAPGEGWGADAPSAGAVFLFRGGSTLTPWRRLGQSGLGVNQPGDNFGYSLAAGDFDNDGYRDLAVGAPHERVAAGPEGGLVFLFRGSGAGMSAWRTLQPVVGATNYTAWNLLFGFTMTVADYNSDGYNDLAVGAPGAAVNGLANAGRVLLFQGTGAGPQAGWMSLVASAPQANAAYGFSLSNGRFKPGFSFGLGVGAPGAAPTAGEGSGRVYLWPNTTVVVTVGGVLTTPAALSQTGLGADEAGDRFGADLAFGDIDGDGDSDLVVGAPGEVIGASNQTGSAFVFRNNNATLAAWGSIDP